MSMEERRSAVHTNWIPFCMILIFSMEIFLGLYVYKMKSDFQQDYLKEAQSDVWEREIRQILNEPKFYELYGCHAKHEEGADNWFTDLFGRIKLNDGKSRGQIKNEEYQNLVKDSSRSQEEVIENICKTIQNCAAHRPFIKRERRDSTAAGLQGPPGPPGLTGIPGMPGLPGPKGNPAAATSQMKGVKGDKGEEGDKGDMAIPIFPEPLPSPCPCPKGVKGAHGNPGAPGFPGRKGERGEDASG